MRLEPVGAGPPLAGARLQPVEHVGGHRQVEDADVVGALRGVAVRGREPLVGVLAVVARRQVDLADDLRATELAGAALEHPGQGRSDTAPAVVRMHVELGPDLVGVVVQALVQRRDADDLSVVRHSPHLHVLRRVVVAPPGDRLRTPVGVIPRTPVGPARQDDVVDGGALGVVVHVDGEGLRPDQGRWGGDRGHASTVEGGWPVRPTVFGMPVALGLVGTLTVGG